MKIELSGAFEQIVREKVESGLYRDADEVVRDAIRLLERQIRIDEEKLEALRVSIEAARADVDAGNYVEINSREELDAFFDSL